MKLSILLSVKVFVSFLAAPIPFGGERGLSKLFAAKATKLAGVWMRCSNILQNNEKIPEIPVVGSRNGGAQVLLDSGKPVTRS